MKTKEISEIIDLAWDDQASFETILKQTGITEAGVIRIMRQNLKPASFRLWRKRVSGRKTKHEKLLRPLKSI
ncbi:TIGR03643 family protein [Kordiimonas aquimaris]|uniref:TIGR03643 family protein n=1 Tax=Kordiimonas aquimaris TaxID=707591 RepID=UPI0021CF3216|nr:TIGR03643 family protein [Kordiimonas aquimaris]